MSTQILNVDGARQERLINHRAGTLNATPEQRQYKLCQSLLLQRGGTWLGNWKFTGNFAIALKFHETNLR